MSPCPRRCAFPVPRGEEEHESRIENRRKGAQAHAQCCYRCPTCHGAQQIFGAWSVLNRTSMSIFQINPLLCPRGSEIVNRHSELISGTQGSSISTQSASGSTQRSSPVGTRISSVTLSRHSEIKISSVGTQGSSVALRDHQLHEHSERIREHSEIISNTLRSSSVGTRVSSGTLKDQKALAERQDQGPLRSHQVLHSGLISDTQRSKYLQ